MRNDLVKYPPTISLIKILLQLGVEVTYVGKYSDFDGKRDFENRGVHFVPIVYENKDVSKIRIINHIAIVYWQLMYKYKMRKFLNSYNITEKELIWFIYSDAAAFLQNTLEKFNYLIHFYEFENFSLGFKGKLLHPRYNAKRFFSRAIKTIHCEYNRALITNGLYGLNTEPCILPNKPFEENEGNIIPENIKNTINTLREQLTCKKVIIYQGIFDPNERRLDEFCEAIKLLPKEFVFVCMGGGLGSYYETVKDKYECDRIIFLPFIKPPYHLLVTKMASIGVMSYFPRRENYVDVINPLFCAPNKIFEFGKFGIPMIANDCPGLKGIFQQYNCGITIPSPITPKKIAKAVLEIDSQRQLMSKGSLRYYNSVDLVDIIKKIITR
jgi:glycosyltransferase involved in cell wall biosynthesis